ncbi:MAG: orotidine-5'-phosphate decarboxylase [Candidatus Margulisbacteria bacterium]|nr:orotidine-5'-phosphate decarboxylase [Candidatus Margulisiibacteriota bacterium]MBU1021711.1 orotidine-5'-phosphate decarboxylase [Candidatus Margulisiibacteriota bacterium]MBU1729457.1 orotidine-5'-phosphate decarboxylase [Candidatus Margulisiibacteriota bacterium]MBU1955442.1 orotidine-5'-phosphate decarboxylase [Candidatus Margulisiibacteriota bacterium]
MNFNQKLDHASAANNSLLCIGLDIDMSKIPKFLLNQEDPIFLFNKAIIDQTRDLVCAYKPNIAFYEMHGTYGMESLKRTIEYIPKSIPVILDAKRGDIGHTAAAYAKAIFELYKADATTVNPYLGPESVLPFAEYRDKGIFVLCLTSNQGARVLQIHGIERGDIPLYKKVVKYALIWQQQYKNIGLVVGATKPQELKEIRGMVKDMPILIPGVGAQGGSVKECATVGTDKNGGRAIINSSRGIIYADSTENFAKAAREKAKALKDEINSYRFGGN